MGYTLNKPVPLTQSGCEYWAKMPSWNFMEILSLSMGYDPKGSYGEGTDYDEAGENSPELDRRAVTLERAIELNQIERILIPCEGGGHTVVYSPISTTKWANDIFNSFPPELFNVVMRRLEKNKSTKVADADSTNPHDSSDQQESEKFQHKALESVDPAIACIAEQSRTLLLNSLELYGVHTKLILPDIDADDLKHLYDLIKPPETPESVNVAGKNEGFRNSKSKALNYMLRLIDSGCECNHANLAKVTLIHEGEWLNASDRPLSIAQLKKISAFIAPPERRYIINQKTGPTPYDPSACKCQLPAHKPARLSAKKP